MPDHHDRFRFEIQGLRSALKVARVEGREALSELFQFELTLISEDPALPFDGVIARPARLALRDEAQGARWVHGIVGRLAQGETRDGRAVYRATLVPRASRLLRLGGPRVFVDRSAPEILEEVLARAELTPGEDFRTSLQGAYSKRARAVQERQSDHSFVRQLMDEEGIFWFFEHREDRHVLVLADSLAALPKIPGERAVAFRAPREGGEGAGAIRRFHYTEELAPGWVSRRDEGPEGQAAALSDSLTPTRRRIREARRETGEGESACSRLIPGHVFTLSGHGREAFNHDYVVTRVEHEGVDEALLDTGAVAGARYENRFQCAPADVAFRGASRQERDEEQDEARPAGQGTRPSRRGEDEAEGDLFTEVEHDHVVAIGNNLSASIRRAKMVEIGGTSDERIGKEGALSVGANYSLSVGADMTTRVSASHVEEVALDKIVKVGAKIAIQCGEVRILIDRSGSVVIEGRAIEIKGDGPVKVVASLVEVSSSGEVKVEATGKVDVKGSGPMNLSASGPVKVKGSNVGIN